jgi:hypothetical protein
LDVRGETLGVFAIVIMKTSDTGCLVRVAVTIGNETSSTRSSPPKAISKRCRRRWPAEQLAP